MGFSVSGSFALLVVAILIAGGMVYTAGSNGLERITEANQARAERVFHQRNTGIAIDEVTYNTTPTPNQLTITVNNTGTTTLKTSETDLLADNTYLTNATYMVNGTTGIELWPPRETLIITVELPTRPSVIKIVTETGIADRATL